MLLALEKFTPVKNAACSLTWIDTEVDYEPNVALLRPYISTLTILSQIQFRQKGNDPGGGRRKISE